MSIEEIRKVRQELARISKDDRKKLYNMRRKDMLNQSDVLYNVEQKGIGKDRIKIVKIFF